MTDQGVVARHAVESRLQKKVAIEMSCKCVVVKCFAISTSASNFVHDSALSDSVQSDSPLVDCES